MRYNYFNLLMLLVVFAGVVFLWVKSNKCGVVAPAPAPVSGTLPNPVIA